MYQLHMRGENLARYGARQLVDPEVAAIKWSSNYNVSKISIY